ncbi:MAG: hypothetical protein HY902_07140 [Deltaproteobacteria bacterium]|nr:hypothetical protein [Deltaproteobacteria bacterium]
MYKTVGELAQAWRPDAAASRAVAGRVRDGLVRGWVTVAGPELRWRVEAALADEGLALEAQDGWVPLAAYLRLHEHIAELDHGGDGKAFAGRWLRDVERQIPGLARWPLKALGLRRGLELLPRLWPEAWGTPAPRVRADGERWILEDFEGLPLDSPTLALLLALQFELAARLLSGGRARVQVQPDASGGVRSLVIS